MFRYIYAFIFLVLYSSQAYGAFPSVNSLKGIVKDNNGKPLEGAIVEVPDLKVGTITDSAGNYFLDNLPKGRFMVVASLISYSKATVSVDVSGDRRQDFMLNESAIESREVVITGQSKATEINRSPVPVVAINNKFLTENISSNIIDAIAQVPGVSAVTTGPNVSKPFIRGLGYNRVLTLYDGMRQEGQQWGDEHGIEVDEYGIERIELVKGPASLIYGSDALAGVVNLIPTPPAPDGKIVGNVTSEYQANNNLVGGSAVLSGSQNGFYWLGRVSHKQAMDYQDPVDGRVYATNYSETDGSASFGLNKKWGYSHLDLSAFSDLQAIPDGSRDPATNQFTKQVTEADTLQRPVVTNHELNTYAIPALHQHIQHYRAMSSNNFNIFNGLLAVNVGFESSTRQEFSHPEYVTTPGLDLQLKTYTYDVKYFFHSIAGWEISAGVNGMYQSNDVTKGTDFVIPAYQQFDIGPFAVFKKTMGKLDIAGGLRFDSRTFHNNALYDTGSVLPYVVGSNAAGAEQVFSDYSHTFSGFTYSLGMAYIFSRAFALKANIARGFRAPNIAEISANGVHPGTNIYQIGNDNLKPEFSLQEDIGVEFTSKHVSANVSVFNNSISNYIFNQKLFNSKGQDSVKVAGNETFMFTASNARLYGGEVSVDIHPHPLDWLHFENTLSVVYAINEGGPGINITNDNRYLPFIPPVHGSSELRASFKQTSKYLRKTFVKVQAMMYATQNRVYLTDNTETRTPGYTLFNAGLGGDITNHAGKTMFNVSLFGNNLFDVAYQDHLSRLKYFGPNGIYNMGRNIGIKLSVPFSVK